MTYWIFKHSDQDQYGDEPGEAYVYDNRHSIKVSSEDSFVYLDKRGGGYGFTGHGVVAKVLTRSPNNTERLNSRVKKIYTAELCDYVEYVNTLDIRTTSVEGRKNRSILGISDVNMLGWSRSIAELSLDMFRNIIELAYRGNLIETVPPESHEYEIPEAWTFVRRRHNLERFKKSVLHRQNYICTICGTTLKQVLEVAHISSYSKDVKNRANPANGIVLCVYCHRAFDRGVFQIYEDGTVLQTDDISPDLIAQAHLSNLSVTTRRNLLEGIDLEFLRRRSE